MKRLRRGVSRAFHFLVVLLCFTLDVKVRAAEAKFRVLEQVGYNEIEQTKEGVDLQSFKKSHVKINFYGNYFGVKENTFISLSSNKIMLHYGSVFVRTSEKNEFILHTREGFVKTLEPSEFVVTSVDKRTYLSVISGQANLNIRTEADQTKTVKAGFQLWIGGLDSSGKRIRGEEESLSLNELLYDLEKLGNISPKDFPVASDHLRISWKKAVDEISKKSQLDVDQSMAVFEKWLVQVRNKEMEKDKLRKEIKEYFRAHALDLPYRSKEFPSESPRTPSNSN